MPRCYPVPALAGACWRGCGPRSLLCIDPSPLAILHYAAHKIFFAFTPAPPFLFCVAAAQG